MSRNFCSNFTAKKQKGGVNHIITPTFQPVIVQEAQAG
jgi:hypothetical protein